MKKQLVVLMVLLALASCVFMCGCTKTISGSPGAVVSECQKLYPERGIPSGDRPMIKVTGEVTIFGDIRDSNGEVSVTYADKSEKPEYGSVATVEGELFMIYDSLNAVSIINAHVVK